MQRIAFHQLPLWIRLAAALTVRRIATAVGKLR